ncbi:hypothetical protein [Endozoicomonas sp.]|uniref:hypothetical protein n=1 Tax=Endozoicomonas sp. TaxID=1892382 RepID=UPI003AF85E5A
MSLIDQLKTTLPDTDSLKVVAHGKTTSMSLVVSSVFRERVADKLVGVCRVFIF